jgi:uncharacterized membrane protein YdfJ with MMPL/SSD domain
VLIPFTTTYLINVRALGVGVAVSILLDVLVMRPVLLPAAEAVLGRIGWWPTVAPQSGEPSARVDRASRLRRPHLPQRRARPAQP